MPAERQWFNDPQALALLSHQERVHLIQVLRDNLSRRNRPYYWRLKRGQGFVVRQRKDREWISFVYITDWLARRSGSIQPDGTLRASAYAQLLNSILKGDFCSDGRSRVLIVHPKLPLARITPDRLRWGTFPGITASAIRDRRDYLMKEILPFCWIPRDLCRRWFQERNLPEPPGWFAPALQCHKGPGLPKDTGWRNADADLVREMDRLIKGGTAKSVLDAARRVAPRAHGAGTLDSKITRLAKRYREGTNGSEK